MHPLTFCLLAFWLATGVQTYDPAYLGTFEGPATQNLTGQITNLTATAVGYIPKYDLHTMWGFEFVGSGIIMSIIISQLAQQYLKGPYGNGCSWATTCLINSFCYTVPTIMFGTVSALFNPAVMYAWAILGRIKWGYWAILMLAQLGGSLVGSLCSWSQYIQYLHRVPIPKKDAQGRFMYKQLKFKWAYWRFRRVYEYWKDPSPNWKKDAPSKHPWKCGRAQWDGPEYDSNEFRSVVASVNEQSPATLEDATPEPKSVSDTDLTSEEEAMSQSEEFQAELRRDQKAKLICFCETPRFYSPFFIYCWWPHIMAGTTLVHWLSFMTGNATQLTNTTMYFTQPVNAPGQTYAFLYAVLLAWLVGLAYFLLTASAGGICTLQLNPAADLSGRILHSLLPIPNKGPSGWSYAWVPIFFPFFGATLGAALMYMSMWSSLYMPFLPYGNMPYWR